MKKIEKNENINNHILKRLKKQKQDFKSVILNCEDNNIIFLNCEKIYFTTKFNWSIKIKDNITIRTNKEIEVLNILKKYKILSYDY